MVRTAAELLCVDDTAALLVLRHESIQWRLDMLEDVLGSEDRREAVLRAAGAAAALALASAEDHGADGLSPAADADADAALCPLCTTELSEYAEADAEDSAAAAAADEVRRAAGCTTAAAAPGLTRRRGFLFRPRRARHTGARPHTRLRHPTHSAQKPVTRRLSSTSARAATGCTPSASWPT